MKKKGIFTRIMMVCLLLCNMCVPAFAGEEDSKGLEQAIVAAKNIITVPDNYTEFTHDSNERKTSEGKIMVWNLNWSEKEGDNAYVSASIGKNGFLYEYNSYNGDNSDKGLAQVTKEKAQISAEEFLKKVFKADAAQMRIVDKSSNINSSEEYDLTYQKFVNEVPVNFIIVDIRVNKYSGKVTSYNGENSEINELEYPTLDGVMESSVAEKTYIEKLGVDLKYYSYYDYKQKKMNVFAGYSVDDNRNNAIDAKTGQAVAIPEDNRMYDKVGSKGGDNLEDSLVSTKQELTKEETDAVNNVANLITKEKAENVLRETFDIITSDKKVKDASLNRKHTNEKYVWNVSFEGAYGEVDAQSSEIVSFHYYNDKNSENKNMSNTEAKNIAESFLNKITLNKFAQTKYKEAENSVLKIVTKEEEKSSYFNFIRQVNGIEFSNNSLRVQVNKANGKIIGYNNNWYEDVVFPELTKAMTKGDAFNKIKGLAGFGLQYVMLDKNKVGLVYNFKNIDQNYIIDPVSGIRLDYNGQAYKDNKLPQYTDISGHWCEKTVKELLENGYYIDGEKFNPDMNITQIKFLKYIYSGMRNDYSDDDFYDMIIRSGVIKKEEKAPSSLVSNKDAAKFIIRYLGHDIIASHPEIFTNPFKDNIEEQYKGYAAMCYALNIIKGDINGNFNANRNITNAGAATIVYNLIKNNTRK